MFRNTYQSGLLSIFFACGSNPLGIWDIEVHNGHVKRLTDHEVNSLVLEIVSVNVATTFISCPKKNQVLGIRLPFLVMIVKNMKRYFSFEITIMDDRNMRRRFRISNFQSTTKIKPFCTSMPIGLSGGWNQIQFNLADFTRRAYGSQFEEAQRVQVNANVRLRRIYFSDRLYTEEELPQDYKLYLPLERKMKTKKEEKAKPAKAAPEAAEAVKEAPAEGAAEPTAEEGAAPPDEGAAAEGSPAGEASEPPLDALEGEIPGEGDTTAAETMVGEGEESGMEDEGGDVGEADTVSPAPEDADATDEGEAGEAEG